MKLKFGENNKEPWSWEFLKNLKVRRVLWIILFYSIATGVLGLGMLSSRLKLEVNQPSPRKFEAKQTIVYESDVLTEQAREQAAREVQPVLKVDKAAVTEMKQKKFPG